jgi:hypothetical protein
LTEPKGVQMLSHPRQNSTGRTGGRSRGRNLGDLLLLIGRFLGVALLFFLFYVLAHTMVQHRFFRGGEMGPNGHAQQ